MLSRTFLRLAAATLTLGAGLLLGQTLTTGAISGKIADPTGAVIPGAKITATNVNNGETHATVTGAEGDYVVSLLVPGTYSVTVEKAGFEGTKQSGVAISLDVTVTLNFKLTVGAASQTVEVTGQAPLLEPDNPNIHTTLTQEQIENTPNPGNDITELGTLAAGATIAHTATGGSNANSNEFNGLPPGDSGIVMDGADYNEPFLNTNIIGGSDLSLGSNAMAEMSVNTNAYGVDLGRFAAGSVTFQSRGGANNYHGDLQYQWNGRLLNAYDYFTKALPGTTPPKPFDNVNNWAGGFGGPVWPSLKNKLFFYFDNEGARIDIPLDLTGSVPSPAYEAYAATEMAIGGCDTTGAQTLSATANPAGNNIACNDPQANKNVNYERYLPAETGANAPAGVNELPFLQSMFALYDSPTHSSTAVGNYGKTIIEPDISPTQSGCNILPNGSVDPAYNPQAPYTTAASASANKATAPTGSNPIPTDNGCVNTILFDTANQGAETLTSFRMDYNKSSHDIFWWRYVNDNGYKPEGTSVLGNPNFNQTAPGPEEQGWFDWTHILSPTLTNEFHPSFLWEDRIFTLGNHGENSEPQVLAELDGLTQFSAAGLTALGSTGYPQGRGVTQYEYVDDLNWTHGTHSFKFGVNFRRLDITDLDEESGVNPSASASTVNETIFGVAGSASESFPVLGGVFPAREWNLDIYAMDTWKLRPDLTVTYGVRGTHNSNLKEPYGDFVDVGDWTQEGHGTATLGQPMDQVIGTNNIYWPSVPAEVWQPRVSAAWQPQHNTLLKMGFGMFSQIIAGSQADSELSLGPTNFSAPTGSGSSIGGFGSAAGCGLNLPTTAQAGNLQECYAMLEPTTPYSARAAAIYADSGYRTNFYGGNPSCGLYSAEGLTSPTTCIPVYSAGTVNPYSGYVAPMVYQYSMQLQHQFGRNTSLSSGYVGNRSLHQAYSVDPNAYQSDCVGCYTPFPFGGTAGSNGAVGTATLTNCLATNTCDADPRFSSFSQTEYGGYSRYDSLQTTFTQRMTAGATLNLNYTWGHCLTTGTPFSFTSGVAQTYRDCSGSGNGGGVANSVNANYSYTLPFHVKGSGLGNLINGWQVSGATYFESGPVVFPSASGGNLTQSGGPDTGATPVPGENPYAIGQWLTYAGTDSKSGAPATTNITTPGTVQWFNPLSFSGNYYSSTKQCYTEGGASLTNPISTGTLGVNPTLCQFGANYAQPLHGPWFNWTNFYVTKNFKLTEKLGLRFDAQFYNLFNHNNLSTPGLSGAIFQPGTYNSTSNPTSLNSSIIGAGAINSGLSPSTSLLGGSAFGGDSNPRMIAFQGRISF